MEAFWGAASAILVGAILLSLDRASQANEHQKERFGRALANALEWREMPYRVLRRSPGPEHQRELVNQFHELQHTIAFDLAWMQVENQRVYEAFSELVDALKRECAEPIREAWETDPSGDVGLLRGQAFEIDVSQQIDAYVATVRRQTSFWGLRRRIGP